MTTCEIQTIAFGGDGVAKINGLAVFIPFTLPAEQVNIEITQKKSRFARGRLTTIITSSPHRISPPCPYFGSCGGCQLQHSDYPYQLEIKRKFVEDSLNRIGKLYCFIPPVVPSTTSFGYRRHISLQLEFTHGSWRFGFASYTGTFLPIQYCLLFDSEENTLLSNLEKTLSSLPPNLPGRLKILKSSSGYILAFSFSHILSPEELSIFTVLADLPSINGVIVQTADKEYSWKQTTLDCCYEEMTFSYSPFSFIQNHAEQSKNIYNYTLSLLQDAKKVLDLYCGIGISTLLLAKQNSQVLGIEINPIAIHHAQENAIRNGFSKDLFICASADTASSYLSSFSPEAVLVNPPKIGLSSSVIQSLITSSAKKIIYISCHPPTLARDCALFAAQGFTLSNLQSFDMFPQTTHVETVVQLSR